MKINLFFIALFLGLTIQTSNALAAGGVIMIKHVGSAGTTFAAPLGTRGGVDTAGNMSSSNPSTFSSLTPGRHYIFIEDQGDMTESAGVCEYTVGQSECRIEDWGFGAIQCDTTVCRISVNVNDNTVTKAVFKYTKIPTPVTNPTSSTTPTNPTNPINPSNPPTSHTPEIMRPASGGLTPGPGSNVSVITIDTPFGTAPTPAGTANTPTTNTPSDSNTSWYNGLVPCGNPGQSGYKDSTGKISATGTEATDCGYDDFIILIGRVINFLFFAASILVVYLLMITGWKYLSGGSNSGQLAEAKKRFTTIAIGFLLVFGAWLIINTIVTVLVNTTVISNPLSQ